MMYLCTCIICMFMCVTDVYCYYLILLLTPILILWPPNAYTLTSAHTSDAWSYRIRNRTTMIAAGSNWLKTICRRFFFFFLMDNFTPGNNEFRDVRRHYTYTDRNTILRSNFFVSPEVLLFNGVFQLWFARKNIIYIYMCNRVCVCVWAYVCIC